MKYLVTGGAGFIGSHLTAELATRLSSRNDEVVVLDNFSSGKRDNLIGLPVRIITGDVRDINVVRHAMDGVHTVFHLAAMCSISRSMEDPLTTHEVNASGTLNVLEAARREGVRRVLFASSSAVYGDSDELPKQEEMLSEPVSPYAISKLVGENYCKLYWQTFGLETVILRYFNVFGPRQDCESEYSAVIPRFIDAVSSGCVPHIFGDGTQTRDFTYVHDIVEANLAAAVSANAPGQTMNIACGKRLSLLELLNAIEDVMECDATPVFHDRRPGDIQHSQACIERARRLMAFNPQFDFSDGLRETVGWFLSQRAIARQIAGQQGREPHLTEHSSPMHFTRF